MRDTDPRGPRGSHGSEAEATEGRPSADGPKIRVEDRRHWARADREDESGDDAGPASTQPTIVDEYRRRAEEAEERLREYIAAFKEAENEREQFRVRLARDVDRRVDLRFGEVVEEFLAGLDDLDTALEHTRDIPEAEPLARGVTLVRDRLLGALARQGLEPIRPDGETFDPNVAEAVRLDPVDDADRDGKVTATLRVGYRLGDRVVRPARVAVGKRAN